MPRVIAAQDRLSLAALSVIVVLFLLGAVTNGQTPIASDTPLVQTVIAGTPSSARHCVSGNAAKVHALGWVEIDSIVTITFDADFTPTTAITRLDLDEEEAAVGYGNPDLQFSASASGTVALYVTGNGQAGCYSYKVGIQPPSPSDQAVHTLERVQRVHARKCRDPQAVTARWVHERDCRPPVECDTLRRGRVCIGRSWNRARRPRDSGQGDVRFRLRCDRWRY